MKIIKGDFTTILPVVAGEMINLEMAALYFEDGKYVDTETRQGYPKVLYDDVQDTISTSSGYLVGFDDVDLRSVIDKKVAQLRTQYNIPARKIFGADGYHAVIIQGPRKFEWYHATTYMMFSNIESTIVLNSIWWDKCDVCIYPHGTVTYTVDKNSLRNNERFSDIHLKLFKFADPLMIELSDHYKLHPPNQRITYKDYSRFDICRCTYESSAKNTHCESCKSLLWGENYVIDREIKTIHCPLCVHLKKMSPENLYVVSVPISRDNLIAQSSLRELYELVRDGKFVKKRMNFGTGPQKILLIGNTYVALASPISLLLSDKKYSPELSGRTIIKYNMCKSYKTRH